MCMMCFVITETHNQIEKLTGIVMSPSGIESTSLLLAHGIGKLVVTKFTPCMLTAVYYIASYLNNYELAIIKLPCPGAKF